MTRDDVLLAILAASQGRYYTPAQIQKSAFLISENLPKLVTRGSKYHFEPYDYGPFDRSVYDDCSAMQASGEVEIVQGSRWRQYGVTDKGLAKGQSILSGMTERDRNYIVEVARWVRSLSFEQLVKSIYESYPKMKVNSIFRG